MDKLIVDVASGQSTESEAEGSCKEWSDQWCVFDFFSSPSERLQPPRFRSHLPTPHSPIDPPLSLSVPLSPSHRHFVQTHATAYTQARIPYPPVLLKR